jgi:hypothetical protein
MDYSGLGQNLWMPWMESEDNIQRKYGGVEPQSKVTQTKIFELRDAHNWTLRLLTGWQLGW